MLTENIKILIVDDDIISTMVSTKSLQKLGFVQIKSAKTSDEGINFVEDFLPDVILMDIRLSGEVDGIETAKIIRKFSTSFIIFFSATTEVEEINRAKEVLNSEFVDRYNNFDFLKNCILEKLK